MDRPANAPEWDLAVIGAGPAGCAAALRAAKAGLRVILLEGDPVPRSRPGETLHPGVEPLLAHLGVWDQIRAEGFHRHRGVWVEWDGPRTFQPYGADAAGPWQGFQIDRRRLDEILLAAVVAAGVEVLRPCRATGVRRDAAGRLTGLDTTHGAVPARWIADASGRRSWLARQLRLRTTFHSPPLTVRFGWGARTEDELDGQPLLQAQSRGWNWRAPLGDHRSAWVTLRISPAPESSGFAPSSDTTPALAGSDLRWRHVPASAGPGYFLLGDAAATLDPSSSHGVLRALMSGIFASHLLAAMRAGKIDRRRAGTAYRSWVREQFSHDTTKLRALWRRHPAPAARQMLLSASE